MKMPARKRYPHFDYEWTPDGGGVIRRSMIPPGLSRGVFVLRRASMAFAPWLVTAVWVRFPGYSTVATLVLVSAGAITAAMVTAITLSRLRSGPPPVTFDPTRQSLQVTGRSEVPFEDIGEVHLFKRRDKVRDPPNAVAFYKEKEQIVFEVYVRLDGKPLTLGEFETEAEGLELVDRINRVLKRFVSRGRTSP